MADGGSAKFTDFPIRKYVAAILEGDPEIGLLYKSICDHNDSENQANTRSVCNHIVPVETQVPEPSEVERKGKEIVVYEGPIERSDESETSSRNDSDPDFEISEDSDTELQDDTAVFELETVKEHVTASKRAAIQATKAKITTNDSDYDTSRTISDIPSRLGNVSRCSNDGSVYGGVNNIKNNVPVDDANSGEKVNQIKEKKPILLTQIKKYLEGSEKNSDKPSVPKVHSGKRGGLKARRTTDLDDDDDITLFSSRKRKANKIDLNKKPKEDNVKKPQFDEAETSKRGAARPKESVVVLGLQAKKQKVVPARKVDNVLCLPDISAGLRVFEPSDSGSVFGQPGTAKVQKVVKAEKPRLDVAKASHADHNDRFVTDKKVPKGLRSRSVFGRVDEIEKKKAAQAKDQQLVAARPLNHGPKESKSQAEKNDSFSKVDKALCLGDGERATWKPKEPVFSGLLRGSIPSGCVKMKKVVKADDPPIDAVKRSNRGAKDDDDDNSAAGKCKASGEALRGPKKLKSKAEENNCVDTVRKVNMDLHLSDIETGTDKSSYGFGGLLRFEPSGSLAVVHAGQAKKQKGVQAKEIGADKRKASGFISVLEPSGSRSGLGRVDEVKEQKASAKAIEPWVDVVKETNNGPKWHARCKESGICSGLGKCGPSASVPVWGRANSRPVDREFMVCQVNHNPADFETAQRFMRKDLTRTNL